MAFTKTEQEAFKNTLLASAGPILASAHREQVQKLIDELYDGQSRGDILATVQTDGTTVGGDTILLIRSGQAYLVPASLFGGAGGTLAALGDVVITDPQDEEILSYDALTSKWVNIPLAGLYVTQAQLDAALAALQLPEGARLVSAELILTSTTAGTITATWVDNTAETESVTDAALAFNGTGLPAAGNFRFDIIQGEDNGTVNVKEGAEGDAASVVIPTADAGSVVLSIVLWDDAGTGETSQPGNGNAQQNDWQLLRQTTGTAPNTTGKFAKVWEGNLSKDGNYSISLAYAEPKNAVNFDGSGLQILKVSFTCSNTRSIIADTVQVTTGEGSTAGEFILYELAGNKAALYHKSNQYWGRIQYRVLFQNSQVRLSDFETAAVYGAAPTATATYPSAAEGGGGGVAGVTGDFVDNTDPANPIIDAEAYALESNTVPFDDMRLAIIGRITPRTGNILFDFTGAKAGTMAIMYHADAGAFTFPAEASLNFDITKISTTITNKFCMLLTKETATQIVEVTLLKEGGLDA